MNLIKIQIIFKTVIGGDMALGVSVDREEKGGKDRTPVNSSAKRRRISEGSYKKQQREAGAVRVASRSQVEMRDFYERFIHGITAAERLVRTKTESLHHRI